MTNRPLRVGQVYRIDCGGGLVADYEVREVSGRGANRVARCLIYDGQIVRSEWVNLRRLRHGVLIHDAKEPKP